MKISDYPLLGNPTDDCIVIVVSNKKTYRTTLSHMKAVFAGAIQHNLTGTSPPTVNNDETQGYSKNSVWFDTGANPVEIYRCVDPTEGAAVWITTSLTIDELGTVAIQDADNIEITGGTIDDTVIGGTTPATGAFTQVNDLTLTKQTTGFTVAGGDTSKTLTVDETIAMSDKADKVIDLVLDTDLTFTGFSAIMTAGEAITFGDICYLKSDGKMWKAKGDAATTAG